MSSIVSSIIDLEKFIKSMDALGNKHYLNFMAALESADPSPSAASLYFLIKRAFECKDSSLKDQIIKDVIIFKCYCRNHELISTAETLKFVAQEIIPSPENKV